MRWLCLLLIVLVQCSSESDANPTSASACDPGKTQACACEGRSEGAQSCVADGSGFDECQCATGGSSGSGGSNGISGSAGTGVGGSGGQICEPGKKRHCVCDGGPSGFETCSPDGSSWWQCLCNLGGASGSAGVAGTSGTGGTGGSAGAPGGSGGSAGAVTCGPPTGAEACDACVAEICCAAGAACDVGSLCDILYSCLNACAASDQACSDACINANPDGIQPFVDFYQDCLSGVCNNDCSSGPGCGSGIAFNDPVLGACITEACCAEFSACTQDGAEVQACIDCLNGVAGTDPSLCQAAQDCMGPGGAGYHCFPPDICGSGITFQDVVRNQCATDNCCAEFSACTNSGADVQPCIDCFNTGGGPLCDAATECVNTHCPIP